jgi:hypothetical protein
MPQGTLVAWGDWNPGGEGKHTKCNRRRRANKADRRRKARQLERRDLDSHLDEEPEQEQEELPEFTGPYMTLAMRPRGTQTPCPKDGGEATSGPESSKKKQ